MLTEPLIKQTGFELCFNNKGDALLLYQNNLIQDYLWIQYDNHSGTFQLVTPDGDLQEMGIKVPKSVRAVLDKTTEIYLIGLDEKGASQKLDRVSFKKLLD